MNKRGGFEAIPATTPLPSLGIERERNILHAQGNSFAFAVLGDMRWSSLPRIALLENAEDTRPLFMVNLGDSVEFGRRNEWGKYIAELAPYWDRDIPYYHTPGGHSINFRINGVYPAFFEHYFGKTDYFVDVSNWRFVFLNTSTTFLADTQTRWLSILVDTHGQARGTFHRTSFA